MNAVVALACLIVSGLLGRSQPTEPVTQSIEEFDRHLESLRQQSRIPGISVAITVPQRIAWSKGMEPPISRPAG